MAYGVDKHPDPPEPPSGHWEYDIMGDRYWVRDYDDDGNYIGDEEAQP